MQRLAAEKEAKEAAMKEQMENPLKEALEEEKAAMQTKAESEAVKAPAPVRAGPFDIFKEDGK